jgi:hypothetical protein
MRRYIGRVRRFVLAGAVIAALTVPFAPTVSAAGYASCGRVSHSGHRYKVNASRLPCSHARDLARYVVRRHRAPSKWTCTLSGLKYGYAGCHRGAKAILIVPG